MNNSHLAMINNEAERIKKIILDGKLYGEPVSLDNLDMVIVASYWAGRFAQDETPVPVYGITSK